MLGILRAPTFASLLSLRDFLWRSRRAKSFPTCVPLRLLGDSVTTDHISPAGAFSADTPAGQYLISLGVKEDDFNSYGSRRGNHEIMMRGTFANVRIQNRMAQGKRGDILA